MRYDVACPWRARALVLALDLRHAAVCGCGPGRFPIAGSPWLSAYAYALALIGAAAWGCGMDGGEQTLVICLQTRTCRHRNRGLAHKPGTGGGGFCSRARGSLWTGPGDRLHKSLSIFLTSRTSIVSDAARQAMSAHSRAIHEDSRATPSCEAKSARSNFCAFA
jgi:hypothetical protein